MHASPTLPASFTSAGIRVKMRRKATLFTWEWRNACGRGGCQMLPVENGYIKCAFPGHLSNMTSNEKKWMDILSWFFKYYLIIQEVTPHLAKLCPRLHKSLRYSHSPSAYEAVTPSFH
jgi:hypothetical protein